MSQGYDEKGSEAVYANAAVVVEQPESNGSGLAADIERGRTRRPRPPQGEWSDGLCDWYTNLFPSCFCACLCCHGCWLSMQLQEKYKCWGGGLAKFIGITYTVIFLIMAILHATHEIGAHLGWVPGIFILIVGVFLRLHVVEKYKITSCNADPTYNYWGELTLVKQ
jgi:hypothetical protein